MSAVDLVADIRRAGQEAWCEGNVDALDAVYAPDYVSHSPPLPDTRGLAAVKESITATRIAYSNIRAEYAEWIVEGHAIAYRFTMYMKHTGISPTLPDPPTGKEVLLTGCAWVHLRNGKVIEEWEYSNYLGFLQQLGVVPPLG